MAEDLVGKVDWNMARTLCDAAEWYLPKEVHWRKLTDINTNPSFLRAIYGWPDDYPSTDILGFSAKPGFGDATSYNTWWMDEEYYNSTSGTYTINRDEHEFSDDLRNKTYSVRCVRDALR